MPLNFSPKARASSVFSCSINRRWIASASRAQYGRSTRYNTKTDCAGDFDIITAAWPASLTPGNELRGYWGSQAADTQPDWHQKPSGRRHDRSGCFRQEPCRPRGGYESARSHSVVEPLRRSAMVLQQTAHCTMGSLQPSQCDAEIRQGSFSYCLVVGRPKSRKSGLVRTFRECRVTSEGSYRITTSSFERMASA